MLNINKYLIITLLLAFACNKPVADGAFVGNWYVLNFEDGYEHWEIDSQNNLFIFNKNNDSTYHYIIKEEWENSLYDEVPDYLFISQELQDTFGIAWIEAMDYPPIIPEDTIRQYHSFVMIRSEKLSIKGMNKSEIHDYFMNSTFKYEYHGTDFIVYLSDDKLDHSKYRANIKANGCLELSTTEAYWSLDTLSNSIVFEHSLFFRYNQTLLVNDITEDTITVDLDEFYWLRRNIKLIRITNLEKEFYSPEEFELPGVGKNGFDCEF
ncbi:MAG: hypothetical protein BalsKO_13270 [Balneolaceae bacterium]